MSSAQILSKNRELAQFASLLLSGLATDRDCRAWGEEEVRAIKTDNSLVHYRAIVTDPKTRKLDASSPRSYEFVASEESRDRSGDIIKVSGWDLTNFRANPIALADHDARMEKIIGNVTSMRKATGEDPPRLYETITFAEPGVTQLADVCERLVATGVAKTVSVGFIPLMVTWPESDDEREKLGVGRWGCVYDKSEQLELSLCAIPCHPKAAATGKAFTQERQRIAEAVWSMVAEKQITREAASAYLSVLESRRVARTVFPVRDIPSRNAVKEQLAQTAPASSVETSNALPSPEKREAAAAPNADVLLVIEALTKRADAADARVAELEARLAKAEANATEALGIAHSLATNKNSPAAFQRASEAPNVLAELSRELGIAQT